MIYISYLCAIFTIKPNILISFSYSSYSQQDGTHGEIGPHVPLHAVVGSKNDDEHVTRNQVTCIIIHQPANLVQAITLNNECVTRSIAKVSISILIINGINHDVFLLRKIQFQFNFNSCYLKNISILCYQNFHIIRYRTFWSIKNWNSSNSLNVKFVEMQTLSSDCTKMQRRHETSKVCQVVKIHVIKLSEFDRNSYLSFSDSNLIKIPSCNSIM